MLGRRALPAGDLVRLDTTTDVHHGLLCRGLLVAIDYSDAMVKEARGRHTVSSSGAPIHYVRGDGAALPFAARFDAVFSTATFHWIPDHDRLFASIHAALAPGGRLVAQCGGVGNLQRLYDRARSLAGTPRFATYFAGWRDPLTFADETSTADRLDRAGFTEIDVSLAAAPTAFGDAVSYREFVACVCVRRHLAVLPDDERAGFLDALTASAAADGPPYMLDYWRLNITARKRGVGADAS